MSRGERRGGGGLHYVLGGRRGLLVGIGLFRHAVVGVGVRRRRRFEVRRIGSLSVGLVCRGGWVRGDLDQWSRLGRFSLCCNVRRHPGQGGDRLWQREG